MEDSQFKVVGRIGIVQYGMVHIKLRVLICTRFSILLLVIHRVLLMKHGLIHRYYEQLWVTAICKGLIFYR